LQIPTQKGKTKEQEKQISTNKREDRDRDRSISFSKDTVHLPEKREKTASDVKRDQFQHISLYRETRLRLDVVKEERSFTSQL
jgi:hypothetical protein